MRFSMRAINYLAKSVWSPVLSPAKLVLSQTLVHVTPVTEAMLSAAKLASQTLLATIIKPASDAQGDIIWMPCNA